MPPRTRRKVATSRATNRITGANRVLYGVDCLNVHSDDLASPTGSVNPIYLDPPFNAMSIYNLPLVGKDKDARPVEAFNRTWRWDANEGDLLRDLFAGP